MTRYVVVGGGIAAIQCVEELSALCPDDNITLVSSSQRIKGLTGVRRLCKSIEEFKIVEKDLTSLPYDNVKTIQATANGLDLESKELQLENGSTIPFDKLCVCTGAVPKRVAETDLVVVLRDQDTVEDLSSRLQDAKRVILVGNGGIALELAYFLQGIEVVWVMKHSHIGDAFFDLDAAGFLRTELEKSKASPLSMIDPDQEHKQHGRCLFQQHLQAPVSIGMHKGGLKFGHAVGPQWAASLPADSNSSYIVLETDTEIADVKSSSQTGSNWPVTVTLTNGKSFGADFVVSAVGVAPNTAWLQGALPLAADGGIIVDRRMETSTAGVFAAGDVCSVEWADSAQHWYQMRLWTQAKTMGTYAAHCMANSTAAQYLDFNFELFAHVTRFLGKKIVLLGRYNGQGIPEKESPELVSYSRSTEGCNSSFVRVLLLHGKMVGAVLIGDTGLEEAFENLILDGLDLSSYGPALLDPDMELDHVFD